MSIKMPLIESSLIHAKKEKALSLIHVHILPSSFQVIAIKNQKKLPAW